MSDTSDLGDYQNPVTFDFGVAAEFATKLRAAAGKVTVLDSERGHAESVASTEFRGFFSHLFRRNMQVCSTDAAEFTQAFNQTAMELSLIHISEPTRP